MKTQYIISEDFIHVIVNGKAYIHSREEEGFEELRQAIKHEDYDTIEKIVGLEQKIASYVSGDIEVFDSGVYYKGNLLDNYTTRKILEFARNNLDYERLVKFVGFLMNNPSRNSILSAHQFLEANDMPITEDGMILGYKGVDSNYYSIHGNTQTRVISGKVISGGYIFNGVGEKIEVERSCVSDNINDSCAEGLHIGSKSYAQGWGHKTLLVKFSPADIVSVPKLEATDKLRVCKYEVVAEMQPKKEINKTSYYKNENKEIAAKTQLNKGKVESYISSYIERNKKNPTVAMLQKRFKDEKKTCDEIISFLEGNGLHVMRGHCGKGNYVVFL